MNIYDIKVKKIENGQESEVSFSEYKGKVLLIVNTATGCGFTPQYEALERLYRKYCDDGFFVLDFPCNQFMEQAKGTDEDINSFCTLHYDTTFPRFKKIEVNGAGEAPLYTFLKNAITTRDDKGHWLKEKALSVTSHLNGKSEKDNDIKWNFEKFLVGRDGSVVARFAPSVTPEEIEDEIAEAVERMGIADATSEN
ncbi:MAG: glutathione peroxidase [Bacteroidales bacterium]|nr:glutathione peroxidase [Bacteroidales bacterium]